MTVRTIDDIEELQHAAKEDLAGIIMRGTVAALVVQLEELLPPERYNEIPAFVTGEVMRFFYERRREQAERKRIAEAREDGGKRGLLQ